MTTPSNMTYLAQNYIDMYNNLFTLIGSFPSNIIQLNLSAQNSQNTIVSFIKSTTTLEQYANDNSDQIIQTSLNNLQFAKTATIVETPPVLRNPPNPSGLLGGETVIVGDVTSQYYTYDTTQFSNPFYGHSLSAAQYNIVDNIWEFNQPIMFLVGDSTDLSSVLYNYNNYLAIWQFENMLLDVNGNVIYDNTNISTLDGSWSFIEVIDITDYADTQASLAQDNLLRTQAGQLDIDINLANIAYDQVQKTDTFFNNIIDQQTFFSNDHKKMRKFIMDWYSTHRSFATKAASLNNIYTLSSDELNELIKSLGFPYPQEIYTISNKIAFALALIEWYKQKGSPFVMQAALEAFGLSDIVISEWWIRHDPLFDNYYAQSQPVVPIARRNDNSYILTKTYSDFISNNPYWQLTESELNRIYKDSSTLITLPSLTSVISIQSNSNLTDLLAGFSVAQRKVQETYEYWTEYVLINVGSASDYLPMVNDPPVVPDRENAPPTTLTPGDQFIVSYTPTYLSAFDGYANTLATWDGSVWTFTTIPRYRYIIGPAPTGVFASSYVSGGVTYASHSRLIATWNFSSSSWTYSQIMDGDTYVISNDSPLRPLRIGKFNNPGNVINQGSWALTLPITNMAILVNIPSTDMTKRYILKDHTHYVYNGTEWIDLGIKINAFDDPHFGGKEGALYKDLTLNGFSGSYSFLEVMLAIAYLFNGTETKSSKFLFYNGRYSPLDKTNAQGIRDNKDDGAPKIYTNIVKEFDSLVYNNNVPPSSNFRFQYIVNPYDPGNSNNITPRSTRKANLIKYNNAFSFNTDYISGNSSLFSEASPEAFLMAINPKFKEDIDNAVGVNQSSVLESMMLDLEYYMLVVMQIISFPFAYLVLGGDFYQSRLKPVVDFFKPFRVWVLDFISGLVINNPLEDSQLVDEVLTTEITQLLVDDPQYYNYDNGMAEDKEVEEITMVIDEPNGCYDTLNYVDAFMISIYDVDINGHVISVDTNSYPNN